jgi:hypothetical protein
MAGNRVVTSRLVGVRDGPDGKQLGVRLQLADGDLPAGWYMVLLPIDGMRPWDATQDEPLTREERLTDKTLSMEEGRAMLVENLNPPTPFPE